jgi:hypothetical protein
MLNYEIRQYAKHIQGDSDAAITTSRLFHCVKLIDTISLSIGNCLVALHEQIGARITDNNIHFS